MRKADNRFKVLILVLSVIAIAGCAPSIKTQSDFDSEADFSSYKEYAWIGERPMVLAVNPSLTISPFLEERVMEAISATLGAKGFTLVDKPEQADFVVGFSIGTEDKVRVTSYPSSYGGYYGGRGYYYGGGSTVDVRNYTEGTVAIDVFDAQTKKAAWHGWGSGTVGKPIKDDAKRKQKYREVTDLILQDFPPQLVDMAK